MTRPLHFVVPGALDQRTGGYLYDRRMVEGLRQRGWQVAVHNLAGEFPLDPAGTAAQSLGDTLAGLPDDALVVLDGLAIGGHPSPLRAHRERLQLLALVHHPLADETGLEPRTRRHLQGTEAEALEAVRGVVVTSSFTAGRVRKWGVASAAVRVVEPGTDRPAETPVLPEPARRPRRPRDRWKDAPPEQVEVLLTVGAVTPRKGQDVLVGALDRIRDLSWRWICAGSLRRDPAFAREVQGRVATAGLASRVHFTGELDDLSLASAYRSSGIFVLPSRYEGYGMALTEALAHGLPVVSTTGGAIPHTVPREAGILVAPGEEAPLALALRLLLTDPKRRADQAAAARAHAARLPRWAEQVEAFENAVRDLVSLQPGEVAR